MKKVKNVIVTLENGKEAIEENVKNKKNIAVLGAVATAIGACITVTLISAVIFWVSLIYFLGAAMGVARAHGRR